MEGSFKGIVGKFKRCFYSVSEGDSRQFQGPFKQVSRWFQEDIKDASWIILEVSRVFPQCPKCVSRKFQEIDQGVSKESYIPWHSSQLPKQKEGLF